MFEINTYNRKIFSSLYLFRTIQSGLIRTYNCYNDLTANLPLGLGLFRIKRLFFNRVQINDLQIIKGP